MHANTLRKYDKYPVAELKKKAQVVFNKFIRLRDKDLPCISCGSWSTPQAGHYMSAGHHSALRFNEDNTSRQCIKCNNFLSGNLINYRKGLVKKIGLERVEFLETYPKKAYIWDRFSLIEIIEKYKEKIKEFS